MRKTLVPVMLTFLAARSLALCVVTIATWCMSRFRSDTWQWTSKFDDRSEHLWIQKQWQLRFGGGGMEFARVKWKLPDNIDERYRFV